MVLYIFFIVVVIMKRWPECGRKVDFYADMCPFCMSYIGDGYIDEETLEQNRMIGQDYRDSY
jgi:hypothetical protein